MSEQPKIAILLATYNGGKYVAAQLDSLLAQTYSNFVVVVHDDGSTDDTLAILQQYSSRHRDRFHLLPPDGVKKGASGSFSFLLEYTLAHKETLGLAQAYMMFCDQDDVWFANKVQQQMIAMQAAEAGDPALPVLVHSDLEVVSEDLQLIAPSLARYQGLETTRNEFCNLVISNLVTGCTALLNEALARAASPVSTQAIMHDWWLALVASAFGKLVFLDMPLVHYRQHSRNTIGAKEHAKLPRVSLSLLQRVLTRQPNTHLLEVARQARAFSQIYGARLDWRQRMGLNVSAAMRIRVGIVQRLCYRVARRF